MENVSTGLAGSPRRSPGRFRKFAQKKAWTSVEIAAPWEWPVKISSEVGRDELLHFEEDPSAADLVKKRAGESRQGEAQMDRGARILRKAVGNGDVAGRDHTGFYGGCGRRGRWR